MGPHCYAVLGVRRDANGKVFIRLRNPWGFIEPGFSNEGVDKDGALHILHDPSKTFVPEATPENDGVFEITPKELTMYFHHIDVG